MDARRQGVLRAARRRRSLPAGAAAGRGVLGDAVFRMKRGDIYLVALDPTEGREQRGHRPVLVISPQAFNEAT